MYEYLKGQDFTKSLFQNYNTQYLGKIIIAWFSYVSSVTLFEVIYWYKTLDAKYKLITVIQYTNSCIQVTAYFSCQVQRVVKLY